MHYKNVNFRRSTYFILFYFILFYFILIYFILFYFILLKRANVKWSRYRPGVAQTVGRAIAVLFHDRGIRRGWVVSSTPRPQFTPGKYLVHILQDAGWAPGSNRTGGKSRPHRDSIPDFQPVVSHYTDWATRPNFHFINVL